MGLSTEPAKANSYERRRELLRILAEHGPMTITGLEACLANRSGRRSLRDALTRLYRRGILARRHDQITRRAFHQIGQNPHALPWRSTHICRHTYATMAMLATRDIASVQASLGIRRKR